MAHGKTKQGSMFSYAMSPELFRKSEVTRGDLVTKQTWLCFDSPPWGLLFTNRYKENLSNQNLLRSLPTDYPSYLCQRMYANTG